MPFDKLFRIVAGILLVVMLLMVGTLWVQRIRM